jgi:hypothetical protein
VVMLTQSPPVTTTRHRIPGTATTCSPTSTTA